MQKRMLAVVLCLSFSAVVVAAAREDVVKTDISVQLAGRLVGDNGEVTDAVKEILAIGGVEVRDAQLATVVEATQQAWVKKDWKFESAGVEDMAKVKALLRGLLVASAGSVSPHVLCQGGNLGSMVQTFAALSEVMREHDIEAVTCFCPDRSIDENSIEDYKKLLKDAGRDPKLAKVAPTTYDELVAFLKEIHPNLKDTKISVKASNAMTEWLAKQDYAFTLVAPTNHASWHLASIKAKCAALRIVGLRTIGEEKSNGFEWIYRNASTEDQQCAARLNILARELYFIQKAREAQK